MKKIFFGLSCMFLLFVSLSLASAKVIDYKESITITKYYPDDEISVTKTIYADYDNADRYSTYDYRHGYSYRTSVDYWERNYKNIYIYDNDNISYKIKKSKEGYDWEWKGYDKHRKYNDGDYYRNRDYREEDDYYLKEGKAQKCYYYPPKDKLFYIKC